MLSNDLDFREYVVAYTNAANIIDDGFQDTEDLDGLFSGFDPETGQYDPITWRYEPPEDPQRGGAGADRGVRAQRARWRQPWRVAPRLRSRRPTARVAPR